MEFNLKEFTYVIAVADYRNISLAAKVLYISQPALSRFIINLEERLGLMLFQRKGKTMELTDFGVKYVYYAREIVKQQNLLTAELEKAVSEGKSLLRVGFMPYSGKILLSNTISGLSSRYADARNIRVSTSICIELETQLLEGKLDVAFIATPPMSPNLEYNTIYNEYVLLAISKNSPFADLGVRRADAPYPWIDLKLLQNANFVATDKGMRSRTVLEELFEREGVKPDITTTTNSSITALDISESGLAIALSFDSSFYPILSKKTDLRLFSVGTPIMQKGVGFAYRSKDSLSPLAKDFISMYKKIHADYYDSLPKASI